MDPWALPWRTKLSITESEVAPKKRAAAKKVAAKKATTSATKKSAPAKKAVPAKKPTTAKKAATKKPAAVKKAAPRKRVAPVPVETPAETPADRTMAAVFHDALDLPYAGDPTTIASPSKRTPNMVAAAIGGLVGIILLAVVVLSGDKAPSKAKYIQLADNVCRPANAPVAAIVKPTSYPELGTAAGTFVTTTNSQVDQLDKLKKPSGVDGQNATTALAALGAAKNAATSLQTAANNKDDGATTQATKDLRERFDYASSTAKSFGFASCTAGMQAGVDAVFNGAHDVVKSGFLAKADALCRATAREGDNLAEPSEDPDALVAYFDQFVGIYNKLIGDLKAVPVPPGDETGVREMLEASEKLTAKIGEFRDALANRDAARVTAISHELDPLGTAADAKFDAYGLGVCGSNFGD
jgi:hypothetical protein